MESHGGYANFSADVKTIEGGFKVPVDTHIGRWQISARRLDFDTHLIPYICSYIAAGQTVIDCGAFNGDHTIAYSRKVGENGTVVAIEAGETAFKCLAHNTALFEHQNVHIYHAAVGNEEGCVTHTPAPNLGASRVYEDKAGMVPLITIDSVVRKENLSPGLIKMDIEGWECKALAGAHETLSKFRPLLVLEVNHGALEAQGGSFKQMTETLEKYGYTYQIIQPGIKETGPQFDIVCYCTVIRSDDIGILIRCYQGDVEWLPFCLASVRKYCRWPVTVVSQPIDKGQVEPIATKYGCSFTTCEPDPCAGYVAQQLTKLTADKYVLNRFIMHLDPDCIITRHVDEKDLLENGQPLVFFEKYSEVGQGIVWQDSTSAAVGRPVEYEFMRKFPFVYKRKTYEDVRTHIERTHGCNWKDYIVSLLKGKNTRGHGVISEFNVIGAYLFYFSKEDAAFHHPTERGTVARQFYSLSRVANNIDQLREHCSSYMPGTCFALPKSKRSYEAKPTVAKPNVWHMPIEPRPRAVAKRGRQ